MADNLGDVVEILMESEIAEFVGGVVQIFKYVVFAVVTLGALRLVLSLRTSLMVMVRQGEAVIVERLGSYSRTLHPGIHFLVPVVESVRTIKWSYPVETSDGRVKLFVESGHILDTRSRVLDFPPASFTSADRITTTVNGSLTYRIVDPKAAVYGSDCPQKQVCDLVNICLRNELSTLKLTDSIRQGHQVAEKVLSSTTARAEKLGLEILSLDVQDIDIPKRLRNAVEEKAAVDRTVEMEMVKSRGAAERATLEQKTQALLMLSAARNQAELRRVEAETEWKMQLLQAEKAAEEAQVSNDAFIARELATATTEREIEAAKRRAELSTLASMKAASIPAHILTYHGKMAALKAHVAAWNAIGSGPNNTVLEAGASSSASVGAAFSLWNAIGNGSSRDPMSVVHSLADSDSESENA